MRIAAFIATCLLAVALVVPFWGAAWLVVRIQLTQFQVKKQLTTGFEAQNLMVLDIPKSEEASGNGRFHRIHASEFVYDGQMYDVVSVNDLGNVMRYLVYPDHEETRLKRRLTRKMESQGAMPLNRCVELMASVHWLVQKDTMDLYRPAASFVSYFDQGSDTLSRYTTPEHLPPDYQGLMR